MEFKHLALFVLLFSSFALAAAPVITGYSDTPDPINSTNNITFNVTTWSGGTGYSSFQVCKDANLKNWGSSLFYCPFTEAAGNTSNCYYGNGTAVANSAGGNWSWRAGMYNQGVFVDDAGSAANPMWAADTLNVTSNFSLMFWFNRTGASGGISSPFLQIGNGTHAATNSYNMLVGFQGPIDWGGGLKVWMNYTSGAVFYETSAAAPTNVTTHFAITFDGTYLKIYQSGTLKNTYSVPTTTVAYSLNTKLSLAGSFWNLGTFANYTVDEIKFFNQTLNQTEIVKQMNGGSHCLNPAFCEINYTLSNASKCNYTPLATDYGLNNYYLYGCDEALACSSSAYYGTSNITCGNSLFTFTVNDEETNSSISATHGVTFTLMNSSRSQLANQSFASNGAVNPLYVCMNTSTATLLDSFHSYYGASGSYESTRYYFIQNMSITNTTVNSTMIYLPPNNYSKVVKFTVRDVNLAGMSNAIIVVQRYYPSENAYKVMAMAKTNQNGQAVTYLRTNDVWYRIIIYKDLAVQKQFDPMIIECSPSDYECTLTLDMGGLSKSDYYNISGKISGTCSFSSVTNFTTCTITDLSGSMGGATLYVYKEGTWGSISTCNHSLNGSTLTLLCNLTANHSGIYYANVFADLTNGESRLVASRTFDFGQSMIYNSDSLIITFFLVGTVAFVGMWNPAVALVGVGGALIASQTMGLLVIQRSLLFSVVVVLLILAYKVKT